MRFVVVAVSALALGLGGCHASASASLNTGKKSEENFDEEGPPPQGEAQSEMAPANPALLGARHDLRLAKTQTNPNCSCLAVALGRPGDAAFSWDNAAPAIDPNTQLVIGVSSDGIACPEAKPDSLGVSYWGYKLAGDDVVVVVENAALGRPITAGAIIPKPLGSGQVYVQPRSKNVPYGRPLVSGDKLCKIGNPGAPRSIDSKSEEPESEPEQDFSD